MLNSRRHVRRRAAVVTVAVAVLGVALIYLLSPLNPNLRYEAGVKVAGTDTAAGTFSHRPLAFRLVMDGIFRTAQLLSVGVVTFELAVRVLLGVLVVAASTALTRGLRHHRVTHPAAHGAVFGGTLVLLGPISAGEPDWMAVLLSGAGVGVALAGRRRPWPFEVLAGALFVAAAGMKIVTLPVAVIGLVVLLVLDRRSALRTFAATVGVGILYVVATLIWVPWEVQWLLDIRTVQNSALDALPDAVPFFTALVADRPVLAFVPAVMIFANLRERAVTVGALLVTAAMVLLQGQYFDYHAIPLVTVAAVAVFRGFRDRVTSRLGAGIAGVVAAASLLTMTSFAWRDDHEKIWVGLLAACAVVTVVWALVTRRSRVPHGEAGALVAALVSLALLFPGATPWAVQLLRGENPDGTRPSSTLQTRTSRGETASQVHAVLGGAAVPVTYLTSGEWTYWLTNPTDCRYPSPLFLQRTRKPDRLATESYRENVACLSDPTSRWLVIEKSWFIPSRQPADVKAILAREWECDAATTVRGLQLCPRRT